MRKKSSGFLHHRFAVSAAVRHKTGNFGSLNAVRGTLTLGVLESIPVKAYQYLDWGVSRSRLFYSNSKRKISIMKKCFTLLFVALTFSLSVQAVAPTCGLTIITHCFQPPSYPRFNPGDPFPAWPHEMALAITNRIEAPIHIYRVWFDPNNLTVRLMDGDTSIDISGGAIIMLDWSDVSWDPAAFSAQDVADYFFDYLFGETQLTVKPDGHSLAEIPIHMIGHSRGCSVNARLVYRLALKGILVDQVTTLDPHPVTYLDTGNENDLIPVTYNNALFADNYWQTHWDSFPDGMPIPGTFPQDLSSVLTVPPLKIYKPREHVHTYYHGTIDLIWPLSPDGEPIDGTWYRNTRIEDETGYNFSRYKNLLLTRPASGVNQYISGAGGTGSRVLIDHSSQQLWANAGFDQRSTVPSVVTVGQVVNIPYFFSDRNSQQTITFYTDADTNPFNG